MEFDVCILQMKVYENLTKKEKKHIKKTLNHNKPKINKKYEMNFFSSTESTID
jgi:hypothetical protein